ncbi:uncharacterized protein LOC133921158 [Phragmites australis]|uniref:uncharacterized protein LOC133921158 n=1 Tax=Phragmites australis TaxID=29695 RepID=UPI002D77A2D7|nr:uncharacterized protein LOC133921158 [Phragmites australis]
MGRPSNSHGSGGVAGDEERQPLRGGLETERAPAPANHSVEQLEARRGSRFWRASVRGVLVLCLLTVPAVLLLLRWQAASSPQWVFEAEPPEEDDDQEFARVVWCDSGGFCGSKRQQQSDKHDASSPSPATDR